MGTKRIFSEAGVAYAESAFIGGSLSLTDLAKRFNCDRKTIQRAILDKVFGPVSTDTLNLRLGNGARASNDMLLARDERISAPHRDLTGALQGDPRVGQSALDRRNVGQ